MYTHPRICAHTRPFVNLQIFPAYHVMLEIADRILFRIPVAYYRLFETDLEI